MHYKQNYTIIQFKGENISEKELILDEYEQEIEDNLEFAKPTENMEELMALIKEAAIPYNKARRSVALELEKSDISSLNAKASKLGMDYKTRHREIPM